MKKQTVRDIDVQGKRVLLRSALNVPMKDGVVTDAFRIEASLPTMEYLLEHGAALIIMSHHSKEGTSLAPVAAVLEEKLGRPVRFQAEVLSDAARAAAAALTPGDVMLLENLRFHPEEEANDPGFAKALAALGDIYVDDDFTTMHRDHASITGIAKYLPAVAGLLVEKEVDYITGALEHPNRPLIALLGGAKVSTKLPIFENLIPKVDTVMLTGPVANTFALAEGHPIGLSIAEPEMADEVKRLLEIAKREDTELLLPVDVVVSKSLEEPKDVRTIKWADIQPDDYIVDAAPSYAEMLKTAIYDYLDFDGKATVLWNGPLGLTEIAEFAAGSKAMAEAIIATKAISIVGGGDTAGFVDSLGLHDKFTWVSTGGGASLELMGGQELPGVAVLLDKA